MTDVISLDEYKRNKINTRKDKYPERQVQPLEDDLPNLLPILNANDEIREATFQDLGRTSIECKTYIYSIIDNIEVVKQVPYLMVQFVSWAQIPFVINIPISPEILDYMINDFKEQEAVMNKIKIIFNIDGYFTLVFESMEPVKNKPYA